MGPRSKLLSPEYLFVPVNFLHKFWSNSQRSWLLAHVSATNGRTQDGIVSFQSNIHSKQIVEQTYVAFSGSGGTGKIATFRRTICTRPAAEVMGLSAVDILWSNPA